MHTREPVPDRSGDREHPEQEPLGQLPDSEQDVWTGPSLTIAEAAQMCGVSASTIRRHLAAGRFPTAHQEPSPAPGRRGLWRIPTQDLLAADLPGDDRVRQLQHALELERTRRRAAEELAAERAHTIQTLERALRALQAHHPASAPNPDRAAPSAAPPSQAASPAGRAPQPGMLPLVPKRRLAKRELSQEEKAAIIGQALSRQRPPKRRWP